MPKLNPRPTPPPPGDPIDTLNQIHAAMVVPFQWTSETPEAVWGLLADAGFKMPAEPVADLIATSVDGDAGDDRLDDYLNEWRPRWAQR